MHFAEAYLVLFLLVFHLLPYNRRHSSSCYSSQGNSSAFLPAGSGLQLFLNHLPSVDATLQFCLLTETCDAIAFGGIPSTTYSCSVNTASREVIFMNSIITDSFVSSVQIQIGSVLNPTPAITTSPFLARIGNDVSAFDTSGAASVGLEKGLLASV